MTQTLRSSGLIIYAQHGRPETSEKEGAAVFAAAPFLSWRGEPRGSVQ